MYTMLIALMIVVLFFSFVYWNAGRLAKDESDYAKQYRAKIAAANSPLIPKHNPPKPKLSFFGWLSVKIGQYDNLIKAMNQAIVG